jgi:hypothetical protein
VSDNRHYDICFTIKGLFGMYKFYKNQFNFIKSSNRNFFYDPNRKKQDSVQKSSIYFP